MTGEESARHPTLTPHDSRAIRLLQLTALVSTLDRFALPPMMIVIAADLDAPLSDVVPAAGAYFVAYGLSQPLWGTASDRFGRVSTMRLALLLAGAFSLTSATAASITMLAVLRGLAGGFFGAAYPSGLIYLGDTVPVERRHRDITRLMVGVALGTALASVGAGVLADLVSWRWAFVVTGLMSLALVVMLRRLPEPDGRRVRTSLAASVLPVVRSRIALLVLVLAFFEGALLVGALTLLPPGMEHAGAAPSVAGAITAVYGIAVLLGSTAVGHLSARWHPARLVLLGAFLALTAATLFAATQSEPAGIVVASLFGLAWVSMHSTLQTWATEVVPQARAATVSLFAGSLFLGSAMATVLASGAVSEGRFGPVYAVFAALALPLGLVASWARLRWKRS